MKASFQPYFLDFKRAAGTSRGVLKRKESYFLILRDKERIGIGECAIFRGLSFDDRDNYAQKLTEVCENIDAFIEQPERLKDWPSILFGLESAISWLNSGPGFGNKSFVSSEMSIKTNGLIWMGDIEYMKAQIDEKLEKGFSCIKMKIGAIDFEEEYNLLTQIRRSYSKEQIELRVDANGAFSSEEALNFLQRLSELDIHSIEQPIKQRQVAAMAELCSKSPLAIALDEELIGLKDHEAKRKLLDEIAPQYIILKPALLGGFKASDEWIALAEERSIGWWATSALESNIGLNAISQWLSLKQLSMPQGLGTGQLFTNNIDSPLQLKAENLFYNEDNHWDLSCLGL